MRTGARLAAAVATAAATLACLPAAAQEQGAFWWSGNDLWSHCSSKSDIQSGLCMGFVAGIANAMGAGPIYGTSACIPLSMRRA